MITRWLRGCRPPAARHGGMLVALALAGVGACAPSRPLRPTPDRSVERPGMGLVPDEADPTAAVLAAHNAERTRRKLAPLVLNNELSVAAQAHAADMARRGRMAHRGGDGSSPFARIERAGYNFRAAAENVAFGFDDVESVMGGWMRSPGHRRNILGPFAEIGFGHAIAPAGATYWCVTFGTPHRPVSRLMHPPSVMLRQVAEQGRRAGCAGDHLDSADERLGWVDGSLLAVAGRRTGTHHRFVDD